MGDWLQFPSVSCSSYPQEVHKEVADPWACTRCVGWQGCNMHWKQLPWPYCLLASLGSPRLGELRGLRVPQEVPRSRAVEVAHTWGSCLEVVGKYLESGRMGIPWAVEQVHRHSLEVVHRDMVRLVAEGQRSLPAQVNSPRGQVGGVHILQEQGCIHSQGSAEERHWKLRNT